MIRNTSNKEYNDIQEMLNDENVSNADAYKRMTEIEDNMELGEKIAI